KSDGSFVTKLTGGAGSNALKNPEGVGFDHAGHLWVADTQHSRIVKFDFLSGTGAGSPTGTELSAIGAGILDRPTGVAVDVAGSLWVADWGHNRLVWLEPNDTLRGVLTD